MLMIAVSQVLSRTTGYTYAQQRTFRKKMSTLTYKEYLANDYKIENGILFTVFSQPFPLEKGRESELAKSMDEDDDGCCSDVDAEYLKRLFNEEECFKPFQIKVNILKPPEVKKDKVITYIRDLGKETPNYDMFVFVFLTYLSYEESKTGIRDERIHLYDGLCHMDEIYDEVKKVDGMQLKPKIFLIQADDVKLLRKKVSVKGEIEKIIKPMKIPQDADRLVIMSDIPQRVANPDMNAEQKHPSFMIEAFGEALLENMKHQPEDRQDLLTLTTVINGKVTERIEKLKEIGEERKEEMYTRVADMHVPLVTSTLTKLAKFNKKGEGKILNCS